MPATAKGTESPAKPADPGLLDALSEAVESGAGLPAVARAAARLLDASVALIDRSSAVLAVAGASPDQEQKLLSGGEGVTAVELRVADAAVGELRYRAKAAARPGDRAHGDDAAGARAGALALAGVGERGGRRAPSSPPCSRARGDRPRRHRRPRRRARRRPRPRRRRARRCARRRGRRRPASGASAC